MKGSSKICLLQVGVVKERSGQIAVIEGAAAQVGFRKIYLLDGALPEFGSLQVKPVEGGEVKETMVEIDGKKKGVAVGELKSEHFTGFEFDLTEGGIRYFYQTQIASIEAAVQEDDAAKVTA